MNKPKMIIFDAGKTLIDYIPKVDAKEMVYLSTIDATREIMKYIVSNPNNYDAEAIDKVNNEVFEKYTKCRKELYEINCQVILKTVFELLDIKLSISFAEVERIIWENSADIVAVDGVKKLLDELQKLNIRSAVISNLDFSGYLLEERLNQLLPNNKFEFVIASSDYGIRKPNNMLFELGVVKSNLDVKDIWYIGDKISVDGIGSQKAGMTPIIFQNNKTPNNDIPHEMISIHNYEELINLLSIMN